MSDLDGLIDLIPIGDVADKLGIDEKSAKSAIKTVLPVIVAGLQENAKDKGGQSSLEKALAKHESASTKLDDIDEEDGKKIVSHVFGAKKDAVTEAAASKADVTKDIIAKVLPIVAPIVLAWLAQQFLSKKTEAKEKAKAKEEESSSVDIGSILSGVLSSEEGQAAIGSVLGSLLGAGTK
jgi:hypothetical protein